MFRTVLLIVCDDCGEQFLYARTCPANSAPSSLDVHALTAFAKDKTYRWTVSSHDSRQYHFCPECSYSCQDAPEN
jgi:hypothetical protein